MCDPNCHHHHQAISKWIFKAIWWVSTDNRAHEDSRSNLNICFSLHEVTSWIMAPCDHFVFPANHDSQPSDWQRKILLYASYFCKCLRFNGPQTSTNCNEQPTARILGGTYGFHMYAKLCQQCCVNVADAVSKYLSWTRVLQVVFFNSKFQQLNGHLFQ